MLFRDVVSVEFFRLRHTGSMYGGGKQLYLSCGHSTRRKYSEPTPKRAHCADCVREVVCLKDKHEK